MRKKGDSTMGLYKWQKWYIIYDIYMWEIKKEQSYMIWKYVGFRIILIGSCQGNGKWE